MQWKRVAALIADTNGCQSMFDLPKMFKFTKQDVVNMADNTLYRHKKQIKSGMDADGNSFEQYSKSYAKRKKSGKRTPVTLRDTGRMLNAFQVLNANYKTKELKFRYGIKANKQGKKMNEHNAGVPSRGLPQRKIADDQALGKTVENGIVRDFANQIAKNLSRMTKTTYVVKLG
jgi:hypothetical protein